jgi:hypothetical protein
MIVYKIGTVSYAVQIRPSKCNLFHCQFHYVALNGAEMMSLDSARFMMNYHPVCVNRAGLHLPMICFVSFVDNCYINIAFRHEI